MDDSLLAFIAIIGIGVFLLMVVLVLPRRRAKCEKNLIPVYEERCSIKWSSKGGLSAGGNIAVARISFYNDFIVVVFFGITIIPYVEIKSVSSNKGFLSSWIKLEISKGRYLTINSRKVDKIVGLAGHRSTRILSRTKPSE